MRVAMAVRAEGTGAGSRPPFDWLCCIAVWLGCFVANHASLSMPNSSGLGAAKRLAKHALHSTGTMTVQARLELVDAVLAASSKEVLRGLPGAVRIRQVLPLRGRQNAWSGY